LCTVTMCQFYAAGSSDAWLRDALVSATPSFTRRR
jgi:hypothetical protein